MFYILLSYFVYELRDEIKDTLNNWQGRERLQDYNSTSKISGLIFSRCCSTTWILCRASPPAVALLCAPTSPTLSEMWDQVRLWVRVCDDVIAMSLGGGGVPQQAKWMNHGSFWGKKSIDHRHAYDRLRILFSLSLTLSLSLSFTHAHTHTHTHTNTHIYMGMSQQAEGESAAVCVRIWAPSGSVCCGLLGMLADSLHV